MMEAQNCFCDHLHSNSSHQSGVSTHATVRQAIPWITLSELLFFGCFSDPCSKGSHTSKL
jgi:hypothetical protein